MQEPIAFEAVADLQLTRFLRTRGSEGVMDSGLWRYSRHPNYFGDASFWWAVWLIALEAGSPWWTAVGPALMTFLLLRVSGVTLTESTIAERRPAYREYVERTSAFVPLPPRRAQAHLLTPRQCTLSYTPTEPTLSHSHSHSRPTTHTPLLTQNTSSPPDTPPPEQNRTGSRTRRRTRADQAWETRMRPRTGMPEGATRGPELHTSPGLCRLR